jgi:hypothetical protein
MYGLPLVGQIQPQKALSPQDVKVLLAAETGSDPVQRWGAKSLADDLATGQGVVFSRAASTLRSVETQPLFG